MNRLPSFPSSEDHNHNTSKIINCLAKWTFDNKKNIILIFAALLIGIIIAYRLLTYQTVHAEGDFLHADKIFANIAQNTPFTENSPIFADVEELQAMMNIHTDLKAKYDGNLAQLLLISHQTDLANKLLNDAFTRITQDHLQLYQDYSKTSILIAEGHYREALINAQKLQTNIDQNEQPLLYIFNLLRLAALHRELMQYVDELNIWNTLQNSTIAPEILTLVNDVFKTGRVSLNEYIQTRLSNNKIVRDNKIVQMFR